MSFPVRVEEFEVESRLNEVFGLKAEDIRDVIMQGVFARKSCTMHHPRIFAGFIQWGETVRALRDKMSSMEWFASDDNNFPLCVHPSKNLVIAVQTGNQDTGLSDSNSNPSNRAPKGINTEQGIWSNQKQLSLFDSLPDFQYLDKNENRVMWILLYNATPKEIRYELSLPSNINGGRICSWQERLVFPAITLNSDNFEIENDDGPEFDISIERKS